MTQSQESLVWWIKIKFIHYELFGTMLKDYFFLYRTGGNCTAKQILAVFMLEDYENLKN